jgi:hypothetical protein
MTKLTAEIENALTEALQRKVLDPEVYSRIQDVLEENSKLKDKLERSREEAKRNYEDAEEYATMARKRADEINQWQQREAELVKREGAVGNLEKMAAVAEAKCDATRWAFETVFKVPTIRTNVHESLSKDNPHQNNGYTPHQINENKSTSTIVTEE